MIVAFNAWCELEEPREPLSISCRGSKTWPRVLPFDVTRLWMAGAGFCPEGQLIVVRDSSPWEPGFFWPASHQDACKSQPSLQHENRHPHNLSLEIQLFGDAVAFYPFAQRCTRHP